MDDEYYNHFNMIAKVSYNQWSDDISFLFNRIPVITVSDPSENHLDLVEKWDNDTYTR